MSLVVENAAVRALSAWGDHHKIEIKPERDQDTSRDARAFSFRCPLRIPTRPHPGAALSVNATSQSMQTMKRNYRIPVLLVSAKMSEIRKALELMKRVDSIDDAPARRLAVELGTLACDRGDRAARCTGANLGDGFVGDESGIGALALGRDAVQNGGGDVGGDGGNRGGVTMRAPTWQEISEEGLVSRHRYQAFTAPCGGTGERRNSAKF